MLNEGHKCSVDETQNHCSLIAKDNIIFEFSDFFSSSCTCIYLYVEPIPSTLPLSTSLASYGSPLSPQRNDFHLCIKIIRDIGIQAFIIWAGKVASWLEALVCRPGGGGAGPEFHSQIPGGGTDLGVTDS